MSAPNTEYPYYTFGNKHLPPAAGNYFSPFENNSWTGHPLTYNTEAPLVSESQQNQVGSWNGYFPWVRREIDKGQTPYPLVSRRGGLSNEQSMKIQFGWYKLPDFGQRPLPNLKLIDNVQSNIKLNNLLPYSK